MGIAGLLRGLFFHFFSADMVLLFLFCRLLCYYTHFEWLIKRLLQNCKDFLEKYCKSGRDFCEKRCKSSRDFCEIMPG